MGWAGLDAISSSLLDVGVCREVRSAPAMNAEEDRNIARLWKINRTIHELVKDRVDYL